MRIFATLLSVVLLSIPGASLFSQDMMMDGTGFYVAAGGGATLITKTELAKDGHKDVGITGKAYLHPDFGFVAGGAAGYDFGDFRTGAEFSYQSANFLLKGEDKRESDEKADDNLTVIAVLANGFFDLDTGTPFVPFIGIGVGAVNVSVKLFEDTDDEDADFEGSGWGFGYQANVGVAYEIVDAVALTLGYKFFGTLETQVTDAGDDDGEGDDMYVKPTLLAHRAELGVRFRF